MVGQHVGLGRLDEYLKEIISSQRGMLSNRIRCLLGTSHMLHGIIYIYITRLTPMREGHCVAASWHPGC